MSFSDSADSVIKATNKVFGKTVTYSYLSEAPDSTITGVFDYGFVEVQGVSTKKPILRIRLADLTATPVEGDEVEIDEVSYRVRDHEPDKHGASILILEKI